MTRRGKTYRHLLTDRRPASLCWYCANAVPTDKMGCSWSMDFEPVDGWTADITDAMHRNELGSESRAYGKHAFCVHDCPSFIPDSEEFTRAAVAHTDGIEALGLAIIKTSVVDMIPIYNRYLEISIKRGYRFVQIDDHLIKLKMPHRRYLRRYVAEQQAEIGRKVNALNRARKAIYKDVPMFDDAIVRDRVKAMKEMESLDIPSKARFISIKGSYRSFVNFFSSDYAFSLSELDPAVLMRKVLRQIEDDHDIPVMESIIRPHKHLKKGIRYGTGR